MPRRFLFGPVSAAFADQNLARHRESRQCLTFGPDGNPDLAVHPGDTWAKVCTRFPAGWKPDLIALFLPYTHVPEGLWAAPIPIIGLAPDWQLTWHYLRRRARCCDLVLTDAAGVDAFRKDGVAQARVANLHGCGDDFLAMTADDAATPARDIDVLFVGNLNAAVQRDRLPWLQRLARLGPRWRVVVRTAVSPEAYRRLARRAKILFSHVE